MHFAKADLVDEAIEIIRETECGLRGVLSKAVDQGDYDVIVEITSCAKELKGLLDRLNGGEQSAPTGGPEELDVGLEKTGYPRFFRTANKLVMIGWSQKSQSEYKHESPRIVLDLLVSAFRKVGSRSEAVRVGDLLPLNDPATGSPFPDYYARTYLRWLRAIGLVTRHGHQGYSLGKKVDLDSVITAKWNQLVVR